MARRNSKDNGWKSAPAFVGTVITPEGLEFLSKKKSEADLIEIRVDHLWRAGVSIETLKKNLARRKHPVLLTLRIPNEGGVYHWSLNEREVLALELLPYVEVIDIEVATLSSMKVVWNKARKEKKEIILSAHSIEKPVDHKQLNRWVKLFTAQSTLCYKIATKVETPADLYLLIDLLRHYPALSWALMGLGTEATRTRAILTGLGSCLSYGYLDRPAASGQPSLETLKLLL